MNWFIDMINKKRTEYIDQYGHLLLGRVFAEYQSMYSILTTNGEIKAKISGKFFHGVQTREDLPAVGDWVFLHAVDEETGLIDRILPRQSKFSRKKAGIEADEQIIAANVDYLFIVSSLNDELNPRRLERYLLLCWDSGANPVIVLSKSDTCDEVEEKKEMIENIAMGVPVLVTSSVEDTGLEELKAFMRNGHTIALVGSSGVGKSTLLNALIGEQIQDVQQVREKDSKGKHTTTHREMFLTEEEAFIIDTPGMRELQMWDGEKGLSTQFAEVEELASECRFRDCSHHNEPGCYIQKSLENGELSLERFESYLKLQREIAYQKRKNDKRLESLERKKWKKQSKNSKNRP
ncbi:ribosome biogenesis GTPase [Bacillus pakistanensis]|uniref:Small ribosomal subunit biogenesis GTPase RsgA n=1 Tax=Rossellomorea pakistanensis TaxID=992288 RepID=A0ABS2N8R3_9BACI|nr:ribosome small subunit-dependent GTPase A [Bacillus pakistanensis]MBM7584245.1 ribosome biogenesis GTPase [Bacillus pakistanensis]